MASTKSGSGAGKDAALTPVPDKKGQELIICMPNWFDGRKKYKISNAPPRTASLEFSGEDLNFMARVLYAEASGSAQLSDKDVRAKEKAAIMNVNHFRLNRKGYPSAAAMTFTAVCKAPGQFESVSDKNVKLNSSAAVKACSLSKVECSDLDEAIEAVRSFIENGPSDTYQFDNFRGFRPNGRGEHIGRSRFWLSEGGRQFLKKIP